MLFTDDMVWLPKAIVHAACASAGTVFLVGANSYARLPYLGTSAPLWLVSFGAGALASLSSDAVHTFVKDEIHLKQKAQDEASLFLGAVLSGLFFYGSFYLTGPDLANEVGYIKSFAVGAGSEIAASFLANMI